MKISIRSALVIRMTLVLLASITMVGIYTYWRVGQASDELSDRVIRQTSNLIDARISALLDKAEGEARTVAGLTKPTLGGAQIKSPDANSFPLLAAQIVESIRVNPEFSAVTVVLDKSGEYVQVSQKPSGGLEVQTSEAVATGRVKKDWVPFGDRLQETGQELAWSRDPRLEEFYLLAVAGSRPVWSTTTLLENLPTGSTPGVTCSVPIFTADGTLIGVASVSMTLGDFSRFLATVKVSKNGTATLMEFSDKEGARIVADPNPQRLIVAENGKQRLAKIEELNDPTMVRLGSYLTDMPRMQPAAVSIERFKQDGLVYFAGIRRISGERRPPWALAIVVPESDFLSWTSETAYFFTTFLLIALGVGALVGLLLADRLAKPLQRLATETSNIRSLQFEASPKDESGIRELDELADSVEALKANLRSMEKLVPADYARWLISTGQEAKLGGERRHITTYFGDIVGFTRLSHELPPEQLVEVLAEYLDVLSEHVLAAGGTLDKFNGDDVMAFWGAPVLTTDHSKVAVRSAMRSLSAIHSMHTEWREQGRPVLSASFGIATGDVVVGNVGSKQRMNYTVIGDSVNLASRLQSLNKFYRTSILVSPTTKAEAGEEFVWRLVDVVEVFGRNEPTEIYSPLAEAAEATDATKDFAQLCAEAMSHYHARDWDAAIAGFDALLALAPEDGPSAILRSRCLEYKSNPPAVDWDGAFEMTMK